MSSTKLLRPEEVSKLLRVTTQTLVNWDNSGKLKALRTTGNHRRYTYASIKNYIPEEPKSEKQRICYCRVSTFSQKEDLERQIEYFRDQYPDHLIIKDIGSGINFKRKGFNTILDTAIKGDLEEVVVTHKDRLCRFGFDLVERIISQCSQGKIVVLDQKQTSPQEELVNDLLSIITVFSSRLYGLRSHQLKKKVSAFKDAKNEVIYDTEGAGTSRPDFGTVSLVL